MSQALSGPCDGGALRRSSAALRAADGLALAASPTFAIMAMLTIVLGQDPAEMLHSAGHAWPRNGMATMYLLMRERVPRSPVAEGDPRRVGLKWLPKYEGAPRRAIEWGVVKRCFMAAGAGGISILTNRDLARGAPVALEVGPSDFDLFGNRERVLYLNS